MRKLILLLMMTIITVFSMSKEKYQFEENGIIIDKDFRSIQTTHILKRYPDVPVFDYDENRSLKNLDLEYLEPKDNPWPVIIKQKNNSNYIELNKRFFSELGDKFILKMGKLESTHRIAEQYLLFINYKFVERYSLIKYLEDNPEKHGFEIIIEKFLPEKRKIKKITFNEFDYDEFSGNPNSWIGQHWIKNKGRAAEICYYNKKEKRNFHNMITYYELTENSYEYGKIFRYITEDFSYLK